MKTNELRIGNLVNYNGVDTIITEIGKDYVLTSETGLSYINISDISPVRIDKDFLDAFRVEWDEWKIDTFIFDRFIFVYSNMYHFYYVYEAESMSFITKIEHIHEFQNLIFTLNGSEIQQPNAK